MKRHHRKTFNNYLHLNAQRSQKDFHFLSSYLIPLFLILCHAYLPVIHAGGYFSTLPYDALRTKKTKKESSQKSPSDPTLNEPMSPVNEPALPKNEDSPTTHLQDKVVPYEIVTKDGLKRKAILTLRKNAKGTVVMCHPAAYNKDFFIPYQEQIFTEYNTLRFDFRRHGEICENQYATIGKKETLEVDAAVASLKNHAATKELPIYGFGISMGAATLIETERKKPQFDGLILQAPFDSIRLQARRSFRLFSIPLLDMLIHSAPSRYFAKKKYNVKLYRVKPVSSIKKITTPIFLMHAKNDAVIQFKAFQRLLKAGKSIIQTWTPETGQHTSLFTTWPELYKEKCIQFLENLATLRQRELKTTKLAPNKKLLKPKVLENL